MKGEGRSFQVMSGNIGKFNTAAQIIQFDVYWLISCFTEEKKTELLLYLSDILMYSDVKLQNSYAKYVGRPGNII